MSTTTIQLSLSGETRARLHEIAARTSRSEQEVAVVLLEGALAAEELEVEIIRRRLAEADAGGPFVRQADVLAWLKTLSQGRKARAPEATVTDA